MFSAGIVAARPILSQQVSGQDSKGLVDRLWQSLRHALPLFVLGFVRLYSVKGLDYAEHVSEYGVHWNFFFTLALLPPSVALLSSIPLFTTLAAPVALVTACVYQVFLESTDLKAYILTSPRGTDFLSQNREGVFSFLGYLSIFLFGLGLGLQILPNKHRSQKTSAWTRRCYLLLTILLWGLSSGALYTFTSSNKFGQDIPVSRRLANLPYVLWTTTMNSYLLILFALVETICFPGVYNPNTRGKGVTDESEAIGFATSKVLGAFNQNGLAVFLLANLGTGAVNLGVDTLGAGPGKAMGILVVYAAALTAVAVSFKQYGVSVKL